jgi:hypothetical protein
VIFLATIDTSDAPSIALDIPADASPTAIAEALAAAEEAKAVAALAESRRLHEMFLKDEPADD